MHPTANVLAVWKSSDATAGNPALAAGNTAMTLRWFVEHSGEQIICVIPKACGVKTNPGKCEFPARRVLERSVANTALMVVENEESGAPMVN